MMNRKRALELLTRSKPELQARFGLAQLGLFGSTARRPARMAFLPERYNRICRTKRCRHTPKGSIKPVSWPMIIENRDRKPGQIYFPRVRVEKSMELAEQPLAGAPEWNRGTIDRLLEEKRRSP